MKKYPYAQVLYGQAEIKAVNKVLMSDWLSGHKETVKFEEKLAKWWGMKYAVSTNSGSSANFIAVQSLELPKGSEVITTPGGAFPTTVSPIIYHGLKPVFVDIDLDTLCIEESLEGLYSVGTRNVGAIIFAHTLGNMPSMEFIKYYGLKVIEDCCDAMGSEQDGKKAGTFGDLATVSFYAAHTMTSGGEGGAILTNDYELYLKCRSIRDWGRACYCKYGMPLPACKDRFKIKPFDHRYYYTNLGMNLKLTEMQAAFGREQLKRVNGFIKKRKRNYKVLQYELHREDLGIIELEKGIVPFAFPLLVKNKNEVMKRLTKKGIGCRSIFTGNLLKHPAYKDIDCRIVGDLKNSDKLFN
ncbi:DegT/DnrJ/EryC1/StrS family aminotransferase, partial [Patescibacteria group bacterium]|nr:DegT/DnrJ/EryC1/StrS family aminotransferase [Patescibacteria group bacterium]